MSTETIGPVRWTPFRIARVAARHRLLLIAMPVVTAAAAMGVGAALPRFTARSRFAPDQTSAGGAARLAGLAAQFGISMGGQLSESPDFYADLMKSGSILRETAVTHFHVAAAPGARDTLDGTLEDLLHIKGAGSAERERKTVEWLDRHTSASASTNSGIVTVEVTAPWPGLAEAINARMLALLSNFNLGHRQTRAHGEREFTSTRLAQAAQELHAAENELAAFSDHNRMPELSANLMLQLERLRRTVALRQEVYATLAQAFETARIDEVRTTPVITFIERPEGTAAPKHELPFYLVAGVILGLALAVGVVAILEYVAAHRSDEDYLALRGRVSEGASA